MIRQCTSDVPVCQTIMYRKARTREKNVNRSQSTSTHQHQSNDVSMSVCSTKLAWYNICSHSAGFLNLYNCTSPIPELTTTSHTPTGTERVNSSVPNQSPIGNESALNAGSLGWPFPMLKYKHVFEIKYTEAILSSIYHTALRNCYSLKLLKCRLQLKKLIYCVIYYNFWHTFVPYG